MKIIVCIKQVPNTNVIKINPVTGTLIRDGVPSIMNPDDKGGLEMALRLKDQLGAHVTVITMGPPQADAICREAFAMGADRAIILSDRRFAGADTLATSYALAGALKTLDYDLIICGRQAIDGDTAQVPVSLAQHLDLPQVTYVTDLKVDGKRAHRAGHRQPTSLHERQGHHGSFRKGSGSLECRSNRRGPVPSRTLRFPHAREEILHQAAKDRRPGL